jgi:hypothetical protein
MVVCVGRNQNRTETCRPCSGFELSLRWGHDHTRTKLTDTLMSLSSLINVNRISDWIEGSREPLACRIPSDTGSDAP